MAVIFPTKLIQIKTGEVRAVTVQIPPGRKVVAFKRTNDCVDNWPIDLPPGASGWTLNGMKNGVGKLTCVLDNEETDSFTYVVGELSPVIQPAAVGAIGVELWEGRERHQTQIELSPVRSYFGIDLADGEIVIMVKTPNGVWLEGKGKFGGK